MRRWLGPLLALGLALAGPVAAQQVAPPPDSAPLLTIAPDRLFAGTLYGRAVQARIDRAAQALVEENRRSEAALTAEEKALTERRTALPAKEFRVLAEAFDRKANGIRTTQEAKAHAITAMSEDERKRFFKAVLPVLGQIMTDSGAVAIIDQSTVFLSFDRIDITATAIARIDALLGTGPDAPIGNDHTTKPAPSPAAAVPEAAPASPPAPPTGPAPAP